MPYSHAEKTRPNYYRSVFLSDFHIGAKGFDASALVDFLDSFECEYLYLVGDIIDGWKLNKRWHWTEDCTRVLDALVAKKEYGTKITYLPGNHDEEVRTLRPHRRNRFAKRMGIHIRDKVVHETSDGRRMLVLHGDQFDRKLLKGPLSQWSDRFFDKLMDLLGTHTPPQVRVNGKIKRFSLAKSLSKHGQWALNLLNDFESAVYKMCENTGLDGLICGHTHIPVIKPIKTILYANCGSWLRTGHTALVEHGDGALQLIDCPASHDPAHPLNPLFQHNTKFYALRPDLSRHRAVSLSIKNTIRRLWPEKDAKLISPAKWGEWIEIQNRDSVLIKRYAGLSSHALCTPQNTPAEPLESDNSEGKIFITCRPDHSWQSALQRPLYLYETFIAPLRSL